LVSIIGFSLDKEASSLDPKPINENIRKFRKSEIPKIIKKLRLAQTKITIKKWIKIPKKFGKKVNG
jgi:hypothetical protein